MSKALLATDNTHAENPSSSIYRYVPAVALKSQFFHLTWSLSCATSSLSIRWDYGQILNLYKTKWFLLSIELPNLSCHNDRCILFTVNRLIAMATVSPDVEWWCSPRLWIRQTCGGIGYQVQHTPISIWR